jgi:hypothetical protein
MVGRHRATLARRTFRDGVISGRFRGANAPLRQGAAGPFRPDIREVIEADDGSTIMLGASRKRRQKKEMAARSARLLSDQRRAAGARDHRCEAEFAASDSYRGPHDNHVLRTSV